MTKWNPELSPVLLLSVLAQVAVAVAQTNETDATTLLTLPQSAPNWAAVSAARAFSGWSADGQPVCNWTGVACNKANRVSSLNLSCHGCPLALTGTLPPGLAQLDQLDIMDLSNNSFSGSLPLEYGSGGALPMLTSLVLASNNISGQLVSSWLTNSSFVALIHLDLSFNRLTGSLPADMLLDQLQVLDLQNNSFIGTLPSGWSQTAVLAGALELRLSSNQLTGSLPDTWAGAAAFPNLQVLNVNSNGIQGTLPAGWSAATAFPKLQQLDLSSNLLHGPLAKQWGTQDGWIALASLNLSNNSLTGTLPADWASDPAFPVMQTLLLGGNQLIGGLQPSWGSSIAWSALVHLSLSGNPINGTLPVSWGFAGAFPVLQVLQLEYAGLQGTLPSSWGVNNSFPQLAYLNLAGNCLTGTLPAWGNAATSSLPVLTALRLDWNELSGTIPASFTQLPDLTSLGVSPGNYQLCGAAPERARFVMCRQLGSFCHAGALLGTSCQQPLAARGLNLPRPVANGIQLLAALGLLGVAGGNITAEDDTLVEALAELLPATAGQVSVLRDVAEAASTQSAAGRKLLAGQRSLLQASNASEHAVVVSLQTGPTANATALEGQLVDSVNNGQLLSLLTARGAELTEVQLLASVPFTPFSLQAITPIPPSPPSPAATVGASRQAQRRGLDKGAIVATVMVPIGVVGLIVAAGLYTFRHRWEKWITPGKGLGDVDTLVLEPGMAGPHSSHPPPSNRSSPLPLVDQLRSWLHPEAPEPGFGASSSGSDLGNYEHTDRHTGDAMALWDDALRRAGMTGGGGGSPEHSSPQGGQGSSTSQQLLARGSGPGRPDESRSGSSLPLALSRASWDPLHRGRSRSAGSSPAIRRPRHTDEQFLLPNMPWHDWEIAEGDIVIDKRPDGSDWELGSGAFGKVYRAVLSGMTSVAVKVLHENDQDVNFGREIAILRSCRHSNIVQFLGVCVTRSGRVMLVTEYMSGGDLWHALGRPAVSRAVFGWHVWGHKVAIDLARGLHFLHSRVPSIVHFDLKSHNILLARDGTAKIADVGVARILTQAYVSQLGEIAGTFAWASPELLLGQRCSEKADIYAFGVVVWELATGQRPQRGQLREVLVPEELPEAVHQLMVECMDADAVTRPSAREIFDRLTAIHPLDAVN